jgi:hypothetical protein
MRISFVRGLDLSERYRYFSVHHDLVQLQEECLFFQTISLHGIVEGLIGKSYQCS